MAILNLTVSGQQMQIERTVDTVEKSLNYIRCVFQFQTEDWNATVKAAYFRNPKSGEIYSQVLQNDECTIPHEALEDEGYVTFSVIGEKEDYRITSSSVSFFNRPAVYGGEPSDPTPSEYDQLIGLTANAVSAAEDAQATANEIKQQAESGAFDGARGPQGEQGPQGEPGKPGKDGAPGKDGSSATVTVGTVSTGEPDTPASVTNSGTENAAVLDFVIPKGADGASPFNVISPGKTEADAYEISFPGMYVVSSAGYISIGSVNNMNADLQTKTPIKVGYPTAIFFGYTGLTADDAIGYIVMLGSDVELFTVNVKGELNEQIYKLSDTSYRFVEDDDENIITVKSLWSLLKNSFFPLINEINEKFSSINNWKKLADITTTEEVAQIEVTQDMQGNAFSIEKLVILIRANGSESNSANREFRLFTKKDSANFTAFPFQGIYQISGQSFTSLINLATLTEGEAVYNYFGMNSNTLRPYLRSGIQGGFAGSGISYTVGGKKISYIKITADIEWGRLGTGTIVQIWGC